VDIPGRIDTSPDFLLQVGFSDEVMFHVSGVVNKYNCRTWGSQNPCVTCELERGGPKVKVWAGLMHDKLIGPFFLFGKDCDHMLVLGHAGAVCAAPITTSNYPPTRWGATLFLTPW
jgi:hypothetical protein